MLEDLKKYVTSYLPKYLGETLQMVFLTAIIAFIFGMILGAILYLTRKSKSKGVRTLYKVLDVIVGILRSFPFYILIFVLIPFTRIVMQILTGRGTFISTGAFYCTAYGSRNSLFWQIDRVFLNRSQSRSCRGCSFTRFVNLANHYPSCY